MRIDRSNLRKAHSIVAAYSEKAQIPYPFVGLDLRKLDLYGESGWMGALPVVDLNMEAHYDWFIFEDTVAHEMVHLKYPNVRHGQKLDKLTETLLGRKMVEQKSGVLLSEPKPID